MFCADMVVYNEVVYSCTLRSGSPLPRLHSMYEIHDGGCVLVALDRGGDTVTCCMEAAAAQRPAMLHCTTTVWYGVVHSTCKHGKSVCRQGTSGQCPELQLAVSRSPATVWHVRCAWRLGCAHDFLCAHVVRMHGMLGWRAYDY